MYQRKMVMVMCFLGLAAGLLLLSCTGNDDEDEAEMADWAFLIWMNGDNDLEDLVIHDLNELEAVGSGNGVHVIVQADRIEGYSTADGDWTGTRRYYIEQDDDPETITSTIIGELGEIDMGSPQAVSDFLLWAHTNWPAKRYILIFWNHGDGWSMDHVDVNSTDTRGISWDDSSGSYLSIARGDLRNALANFVTLRGPVDIIGFDACNMSAWEVAHSMRDQALIMTASQAWVGEEGYTYGAVLTLMKQNPAVSSEDVAREMCRSSVVEGGELTHAAIDLSAMDHLASTIDFLAAGVLDDSSLEPLLMDARQLARGTDSWKNWYLDVRDLATVLASSSNEAFLAQAGNGILAAMDQAVIVTYGNEPYGWAGGLHIFFNLDWPDSLEIYHTGEGATWSQATRWDELLLRLAENY